MGQQRGWSIVVGLGLLALIGWGGVQLSPLWAASGAPPVRIVDQNGNNITNANPLSTTATLSGTITIGSVTLTPQSGSQASPFYVHQDPSMTVNSGIFSINNVSGTVSLPTGAATAAKQPALGTAGTPSADVLTVQGASGGTGLPVINSNIEAALTAGTAPAKGAAILCQYLSSHLAPSNGQTVVIPCDANGIPYVNPGTLSFSTDSLAIWGRVNVSSTATTGDPSPISLDTAGNQYVNIKAGSAIAAQGQGATGAAVPSGAVYLGGNGSGNLTGFTVGDAIYVVNLATHTKMIAGVSAKKTYITQINLVTAAAENLALVEGTGTICTTGVTGMAGGSTAATGWNFAANGGLQAGSGIGIVAKTATAADDVCLMVSGTGQVSGTITYTQY